MKRRKFLELAALTPLAATVLSPLSKAQIPPTRPTRGGFPPRGPVTYEPTGPGIQVRFLDTGGLTARATGYAGIGQFSRERKFLTGIIMEATMGLDYKPDQRLFSHSSVSLVADTVKVLSDSRKYIPVEGQKVYLTHLSRMVQPPQEELDRTLPDPLRAAYDGLEVVFR